jgi:hypothetical protein
MKYLITESQLDKAVFIYLSNQDFIQIDKMDNVYFINSEDDEHGQIRYNKKDSWCAVYEELIDEISIFFSLSRHESLKVISRWVQDTLQMKVTNIFIFDKYLGNMLKIPNN